MLLMPNGKEGKSFYFIKNDVTQKDIDEFIKINLEFINTAYKKGEIPLELKLLFEDVYKNEPTIENGEVHFIMNVKQFERFVDVWSQAEKQIMQSDFFNDMNNRGTLH
tara:strand:+ start:1671 stop:1994 length:324 start_codon:yes stop_codon:yes gene_type:complete